VTRGLPSEMCAGQHAASASVRQGARVSPSRAMAVAMAISVARSHPDEYIRHSVEIHGNT